MRFPLLWAFAAWFLGARSALALAPLGVLGCGVATAIVGAGLLAALRRRRWVAALALALFFCGGGLGQVLLPDPVADLPCGAEGIWRVQLEGPLSTAVSEGGRLVRHGAARLLAQRCGVTWRGASGRIGVTLPPGGPVGRGDTLAIMGHLRGVEPRRNPTDVDFAALARRRDLSRYAVVTAYAVLARADEGLGGGWLASVDRARARAVAGLARVLGSDVAALGAALGVGEKTGLSPDTRERWAEAGMAHLLAISGLHIGLVVGAIFLLLQRGACRLPPLVCRWPAKRVAAPVAMVVVAGFCVWVGAPVSAQRATVMALAMLAGVVIGRPGSVANALGCAGLFIAVADPRCVDDAGFLLSFTAVAALIAWGQRPRASYRAVWPRPLVYLGRALVASVVASAATLPLIVALSGAVSVVGPLCNLAALPLAGLATLGSLALSLSLLLWPALGTWLAPSVAWPLRVLDALATWASSFSWSTVRLAPLSWWEAMAFWAMLAALLLWHWPPLRRTLWVSLPLLLLAASWRAWPEPASGTLRVWFPHVGHGDGAIVLTPDDSVLVVDAGGAIGPAGSDPGRRVMAPLLRRLGISHIDLAVVTHPHPDHLGGFAYLAQHFSVGELWWNGQGAELPAMRALQARVADGGGRSLVARDLPRFFARFGLGIEVLHPRSRATDAGFYPALSVNDNSLVLRLRHGQGSLLLTGDIEREAEAMLASHLMPTDIVKAAHHGSRTSTTAPLLDATRPSLVVIPCGAHNPFGMPHTEVLARLAARHIPFLRPDRDGTLFIEGDGTSWRAKGWRRNEGWRVTAGAHGAANVGDRRAGLR